MNPQGVLSGSPELFLRGLVLARHLRRERTSRSTSMCGRRMPRANGGQSAKLSARCPSCRFRFNARRQFQLVRIYPSSQNYRSKHSDCGEHGHRNKPARERGEDDDYRHHQIELLRRLPLIEDLNLTRGKRFLRRRSATLNASEVPQGYEARRAQTCGQRLRPNRIASASSLRSQPKSRA